MHESAYKQMFESEEKHWWFKGRRAILQNTIKRFYHRATGRILDIGSGTGYNLLWLEKLGGHVTGLEPSEDAIRFAQSRNPSATIVRGTFPETALNSQFDLVTLFDVLEHIENDAQAADAVRALLAPGGIAVITVPAFSFLWSQHDVLLHHYRRYTIASLKKVLTAADVTIQHVSYFNFFLFPLVALYRVIQKIKKTKNERPDDFLPHPIINTLLNALFSLESYCVPWVRLPWGVSIICVIEKKSTP